MGGSLDRQRGAKKYVAPEGLAAEAVVGVGAASTEIRRRKFSWHGMGEAPTSPDNLQMAG